MKMENKILKFKNKDKVKIKATGYKATIYDYEEIAEKYLIRFNGRHSLDLFAENELEGI